MPGPLSPQEIVKILSDHEKFLNRKPGGVRANLTLADMHDAHS